MGNLSKEQEIVGKLYKLLTPYMTEEDDVFEARTIIDSMCIATALVISSCILSEHTKEAVEDFCKKLQISVSETEKMFEHIKNSDPDAPQRTH